MNRRGGGSVSNEGKGNCDRDVMYERRIKVKTKQKGKKAG